MNQCSLHKEREGETKGGEGVDGLLELVAQEEERLDTEVEEAASCSAQLGQQ